MPVPEEVTPSWAEDIEQEEGLPPSTEEIRDGLKIVTEYMRRPDDDVKVKVTRTYKIEKRQVPKSIARRKCLPKFGQSKGDKTGPNPATTIAAEEVFMQFITNKEEVEKSSDDVFEKLKSSQMKGMVKCRYCKEDHWTTQCPYKDTLGPLQEKQAEERKPSAAAALGGREGASNEYIPPNRREGAIQRKGESMPTGRRENDNPNTLKVTSLSENATDADVQELFGRFGDINRLFLVKEKSTGKSRGLAFVSYKKKEDAERALSFLNGFGYDHLILQVEWSLPKET